MATNMVEEDVLQRMKATIYGQCAGDAIGLLTEFLTKKEAKGYFKKVKKLEYEHKKYVNDMHRSRWQEGDWTDDSDHMLIILLSIIKNQGKVIATEFSRGLKDWRAHGFPELGDTIGLGIGSTTLGVISHSKFLTEPHEAATYIWEMCNRNAAPNGGLMRTSILGIHDYQNLDKVIANTLEICRTTHIDPRCQASAVAVTVAIALMLQHNPEYLKNSGKYSVPKIIQTCYEHASMCLETEEQKQELMSYLQCEKLSKLNLEEVGKIGYTYKCLGAGFWALKQDNFRDAIQEIVFEAGDADTNGCVAGALLACKLGLDAIPKSWREKLLHKQWLDDIIERYFQMLRDKDVTKVDAPEST